MYIKKDIYVKRIYYFSVDWELLLDSMNSFYIYFVLLNIV